MELIKVVLTTTDEVLAGYSEETLCSMKDMLG